tara:strand:- start:842 stop:1888 length:1047 start_codon:yes stop_codon:yes gene_type:complete
MENIILNNLRDNAGTLIADGATGTNYFYRGLETGDPPELWNLSKPNYVAKLHEEFIEAGSDIILTNSFGGSSSRLKFHGNEGNVKKINLKAAEIAKKVAIEYSKKYLRKIIVAGSVGPTGDLFEPFGVLNHSIAEEIFFEQIISLKKGGVDLIWIETISSLEEVDAALAAAERAQIACAVTMSFDSSKKTMMGVSPRQFVEHVCNRKVKPVAIGANCGIGPSELVLSIYEMKQFLPKDILLIAKGNCGIPEYKDGEIYYKGNSDLMGKYGVLSRDVGADIIGGCCGTNASHIASIRNSIQNFIKKDFTIDRIDNDLGVPWKDASEINSQSIETVRTNKLRKRRKRKSS